ncbi:DUF1684 domain-containing protein [Catellatospora sp. KI3]|uniref:DUF1684 domain-containing protein n=1 Tax=Catellatospora sp. KI3 TaxID=3041620 RepID=UPI0024826EBF|nr:DUF1684 domain-containing protein [Catellatospora sp. KI3]MDI1464510.1 DUF1684 domain-containing protein [Catellatospora sp. KI3]
MVVDQEQLIQDWTDWHTRREDALRRPYGWLSLTALHWLDAQSQTYPQVPGRWSADADGVHLHATPADGLTHGGEPIDGEVVMTPQEGAAGLTLLVGDRQLEVIQRGGSYALRVRDPQAATRLDFTGVPAYAPSPQWVIPASFRPYEQPQTVAVDAVVPGLVHEQTATGVLSFDVDGVGYTLTAFDGGEGELSVLFKDATSGITTHAGARSLTVGGPDDEGTVVLDFNRAVNLPCAFTEYGTCPLPPPENVLPLAVEAGERRVR